MLGLQHMQYHARDGTEGQAWSEGCSASVRSNRAYIACAEVQEVAADLL